MNSLAIIHLSDLHFFDSDLQLRHLLRSRSVFSKRLVGLLNAKLHRKKRWRETVRRRLLGSVEKRHWDYLVISGDFTNLSTEREFMRAREGLDPLIKKGNVILTAGNHDRYVRSALQPDLMVRYFGDCFPFRKSETDDLSSPAMELNSEVVLFELEQAVPRCIISSKGKILSDLAVVQFAARGKYAHHTKIAVGHYPAFLPKTVSEAYWHSLAKRREMQKFLVESEMDLYLHGHIHKSWTTSPVRDNRLICVNSGGCCRHKEGVWSGYHAIRIENGNIQIDRIQLAPHAV